MMWFQGKIFVFFRAFIRFLYSQKQSKIFVENMARIKDGFCDITCNTVGYSHHSSIGCVMMCYYAI